MVPRTLETTHFFRKLRGYSQSILVQASDNGFYAIKFLQNSQSPKLLFNESMGCELYKECGLPVPTWAPIHFTESFLDHNPQCWPTIDSRPLRPEPGLHFGSKFVGMNSRNAFDILPGAYFTRIVNRLDFWLAWIVDCCASHSDSRQAVFVETDADQFHATFIDFGYMFSEPKRALAPLSYGNRYLDWRVYSSLKAAGLKNLSMAARSLNNQRIWRNASSLPDEWKSVSALRGLSYALHNLGSARYVEDLIDCLIQTIASKTKLVEDGACDGKKHPDYTPRAGVSAQVA